jgi:hypothetical protein
MKFLPHSFGGVAIAAALLASSAVSAQTLGGGGGPAGDAGQVEKCDAPKGTLAVVEPQYAVLQSLSRYGLQSPAAVIRLIIQQSNCFQIVERGAAMQNMAQERALASSGQLQGGQNVGQGQMVAADFILTPNVVFSDPNAGGVGGGIGGLLGSMGGRAAAVGALAGGVKFKEAQTAMTIADTRSGIQVAAAQGSASQTDINLGAAVFGRYGGGGLGGYTSTAEGKIIAASKIFPGFRMFFGSSARLMARIMSTAPAPVSSSKKPILCRPTPCSPVQVPPMLQRAGHQLVVQGFGGFAFFGDVGVEQVAEVEVAVAHVADQEVGDAAGIGLATDSSRQSARRLMGTQVSVLMARQPGRLCTAAK